MDIPSSKQFPHVVRGVRLRSERHDLDCRPVWLVGFLVFDGSLLAIHRAWLCCSRKRAASPNENHFGGHTLHGDNIDRCRCDAQQILDHVA